MAYPDLPSGSTFWRCPSCGNESLFQASGIRHIECGMCGRVWTVEQLKSAHTSAASSASGTASP